MKEQKPKGLKISKRAKFTSFLFLAVCVFVGAAIIKAANTYYDIDAGKIIVNEVQRVVKSGQTALEIVGTSKFGDGGAANYAQISETGDLSFMGAATSTISKSNGELALQTTGQNLTLRTLGSGNLAITSAAALNLAAGAASSISTGTSTLGIASGGASGWTNTAGNLSLATITSGNIVLNPSGTVELQKNTNIAGDLGVNGTTSADITSTSATATLFNSTVTNLSLGGAAATINIGPTGSGAGNIVLAGGSGDTGCTIDQATGNLACSGNITGASAGTQGFWQRTGTTLSQTNANDALSLGTGAITTSGAISSGLINSQTISSAASFTGTLGVASTLTASNGLTLTTGALNLAATSGALNLTGLTASAINAGGNTFNLTSGGASGWSNGGNLSFTTTATGALALTSANAMSLQFAGGSLFTLGNGTTNYFQVAANGTLTLATGAGTEMILDPGGNGTAGVIRLGPGDKILTSTGGAVTRVKDELVLRGMVPVFGFDTPVRTATTTFAAVSGVIEDYPFPAALDGTTRVHKFVIRYANTGSASTTWEVYNTTTSAQVSQFEVPASAATDLNIDKGKVYTTDVVTVPINTDDWRLDVKNAAGGAIQIYQIFLAAYDQVN